MEMDLYFPLKMGDVGGNVGMFHCYLSLQEGISSYQAAKCFFTPVVFAVGLVHWSVTLDPGPSSPMQRHNPPPRWLQRCVGW